MDTKQNNSKNHWVVWGCLITLIVGIFAFAPSIHSACDRRDERSNYADGKSFGREIAKNRKNA